MATAENFSRLVIEVLNEYRDLCEENVDEAAKTAANEAVRELRTTSPMAAKHRNKNIYARGWRVKKENTTRGARYIVYNATGYRLTHLLEHGHEVVDRNGRTHGRTGAREHIRPAEETAVQTFERLIKEKV